MTDLLAFADCSRYPLRNRAILLLSAKAGLRAGEIANLTWDMVLDARGQISNVIELHDHAAKNGSGRLIPMHPELADALSAWRQAWPGSGHVVRSERGGPMTALSIVVWFNRAYHYVGLTGVLRIRVDGLSLPAPRGWFIMPADRCATSSCWLAIDRFKRRNDTSTAIVMRNASSFR